MQFFRDSENDPRNDLESEGRRSDRPRNSGLGPRIRSPNFEGSYRCQDPPIRSARRFDGNGQSDPACLRRGFCPVVLDGSGNPVLIIQTIEVFVLPFNEVSEQLAIDARLCLLHPRADEARVPPEQRTGLSERRQSGGGL